MVVDLSARGVTDLEWWTARHWTGGLELESLNGLEHFTVRTRNSRYEIIVLVPRTGEVLLRGGVFFPVFTRVLIAGASLGGGCLKLRAVYPGLLMEVVHEEHVIVTTAVQQISQIRKTTLA